MVKYFKEICDWCHFSKWMTERNLRKTYANLDSGAYKCNQCQTKDKIEYGKKWQGFINVIWQK